MIQLFLKKSKITTDDWTMAYDRILSITNSFPLKLVRVESYNGYSKELNKEHFDLMLDKGTPNEHISFYGDSYSFTSKFTVKFYKNLDKQIENVFKDSREIDVNMPITWYSEGYYENCGVPPLANGAGLTFNIEGALYRYAIVAIGIMLENCLPGKAFMTAFEYSIDDIKAVCNWLKVHFNESFDIPIYFDKPRLLDTFTDKYKDKKFAVNRMEELYKKQFKQNMEFALKHIGYKPTFDFYAEVLAYNTFGTFGFSDALSPWIAVTKDLEGTLQLIAESKRILMKDPDNEYNLSKAERYDLCRVLKDFLSQYILWSPQQREELDIFYTNTEALETGSEDLFGSIMRMSGYRVDICPIYSTKDKLFEAFMYHDPKNGAKYKDIIDNWINENANAFNKFKAELSESIEKSKNQEPDEDEDEEDEITLESEIDRFVAQYPAHERFFISKAIHANPAFMNLTKYIEQLKSVLTTIANEEKNQEDIAFMRKETKDDKIKRMRSRLKELQFTVNPDFEKWIDAEEDANVLFWLRLLISLKLYDRNLSYTRHQVLWDKQHWNLWRNTTI